MDWHNPIRRMGRYINPHIRNIKRSVFDLILWRFGYYAEKTERITPPKDFSYPIPQATHQSERPSAVWIGHSTYMIQVNGLSFLTDPVFSTYCSPVPFKLLKRRHEPAIAINNLPKINIVLISHNHYDHLDKKSVLELNKRFPDIIWVVPLGLKRWFHRRGITSVIEMNWGETRSLSNCEITAVPAQHYSGRSLWDQNCTLWCGFIVQSQNKTFYFAGDTGYNPIDFRNIGEHWQNIDLSLIPIGTYVPEKFMQPVHISPYEAVAIHADVHSRLSLGMHWKTFCLSEEPSNLPPYDLFLAMQKRHLPHQSFLPIEPGQYINW